MLDTIVERFKEPSTYSGFAVFVAMFGINVEDWQAISAIGVAIFSALAVILPEAKKLQ